MNLVDIIMLTRKLLVETPKSLDTDFSAEILEALLGKLPTKLLLNLYKPRLRLFGLQFAYLERVRVGVRVDEGEGEVLELALHPAHAEPVGYRRVYLDSLKRDAPALCLRHVRERLHIVVAVG